MKSGGLTRRQDYERVLAKGGTWSSRWVVIKGSRGENGLSRYGFVVSRKVGGAVVRNRVKRLLREVMRRLPLVPGWDIVIIARVPSASASYWELGDTINGLLGRAGMLQKNNEEVRPEAH